MTWGDVKLIALQTMFSNEGAVITVDDINQEYINAMPGKAQRGHAADHGGGAAHLEGLAHQNRRRRPTKRWRQTS